VTTLYARLSAWGAPLVRGAHTARFEPEPLPVYPGETRPPLGAFSCAESSKLDCACKGEMGGPR